MSSSSKMFQSACKAARSFLASSSAPAPRAASSLLAGLSVCHSQIESSRSHHIRSGIHSDFHSDCIADGRNAVLATLGNLGRNSTLPAAYAYHTKAAASSHGYAWIAAIPAAGHSPFRVSTDQ